MRPAPVDQPLFTFALLGDTHINPQDGVSGSPWVTNRLANDRARWAVAALNDDAPAFVIHLGDMVHPVPAQPSFAVAAERFRSIFGALGPPLRCIPGNHDVGDKPVDGTPAAIVDSGSVGAYKETFGPLYQSFSHGGCHFILHAASILGSGLPEDEAQWAWLAEELECHRSHRLFVLTHYPPYLCSPNEPEHYDNLALAGRQRLLALCREYRVEAVFCGHVHSIFHTRHGETWIHVVPAVSAIRLDYSYLFKAPPLAEQDHGRDDNAKLGYYLVDVFSDGYSIRFRRSYGAALVEGAQACPAQAVKPVPRLVRSTPLRAGVDLRQGWTDPITIPYTGVVDEFSRKRVRNDYLVTALQEAGLAFVRIPLSDVIDDLARARLEDLVRLGHRAHVFTLGSPDPQIAEYLPVHRGLVDSLEVIARADELEETLTRWQPIVRGLGIPVLASKLWTSADRETFGDAFSHFIGHGFTERDDALLKRLRDADLIDGAVFRVGPAESPFEAISTLHDRPSGRPIAYVTMTHDDPAIEQNDDARQTRRVVEAILAQVGREEPVAVLFDCLEDLDRGYYPRHGLYDVRFNPRPAGRALANLASALALGPDARCPLTLESGDGARMYRGPEWSVVVPMQPVPAAALGVPEDAMLLDLATSAITVARAAADLGTPVFVDTAARILPLLIRKEEVR